MCWRFHYSGVTKAKTRSRLSCWLMFGTLRCNWSADLTEWVGAQGYELGEVGWGKTTKANTRILRCILKWMGSQCSQAGTGETCCVYRLHLKEHLQMEDPLIPTAAFTQRNSTQWQPWSECWAWNLDQFSLPRLWWFVWQTEPTHQDLQGASQYPLPTPSLTSFMSLKWKFQAIQAFVVKTLQQRSDVPLPDSRVAFQQEGS